MTRKAERERASADRKASRHFNRLGKHLRGLPMPLDGLPGRRVPRGPLSCFEWALYARHRAHHLAKYPEYDSGWKRPSPEVAEALAHRLGLWLKKYVIRRAWLRPEECTALWTTAAQAAVAVLAAGIAVGRRPYVVYRGEDEEPRLHPIFLSPNRVFATLAAGWSDHFRRSPADRVEDLREDTLSACRRDLVRRGLNVKALWDLAKNNPLYSAHRQKTAEGDYVGGYAVRFKDEALTAVFAKELEASGFRLREHGRRLLLNGGQRLPRVERRPPKQEIAAEWPYSVVRIGRRSAELIRTLERARLKFHVKTFREDIRKFQERARERAKRFQRTYRVHPYKLLRRRDAWDEFVDDLPVKRRDAARRAWADFREVALPEKQWAAAAEQVSALPDDVVTIRSQFERIVNRRWEAVHLWPVDIPAEYRPRWFSASDGSPLDGLDVSASQTQILAVFLGLSDLEARARSIEPYFNDWLADLAWKRRRDCLSRRYEDRADPRLRELVKTLWMRVLYGKPARFVARGSERGEGRIAPMRATTGRGEGRKLGVGLWRPYWKLGVCVVGTAVALVSCVTKYEFVPGPGVGTQQFLKDKYECERESRTPYAYPPVGGLALAASMLAVEEERAKLYNMCMESRGYRPAR